MYRRDYNEWTNEEVQGCKRNQCKNNINGNKPRGSVEMWVGEFVQRKSSQLSFTVSLSGISPGVHRTRLTSSEVKTEREPWRVSLGVVFVHQPSHSIHFPTTIIQLSIGVKHIVTTHGSSLRRVSIGSFIPSLALSLSLTWANLDSAFPSNWCLSSIISHAISPEDHTWRGFLIA